MDMNDINKIYNNFLGNHDEEVNSKRNLKEFLEDDVSGSIFSRPPNHHQSEHVCSSSFQAKAVND